MGAFLRAVESFFDYLSSIRYEALALALACHVAKTACRSRAWRNVVAAAYPDTQVRYRDVLGAYVAGVAVNAVLPARGGDLMRLYLVKSRVRGATYPTLASTLAVELCFDVAVSVALLIWAVQQGVLPGLEVIPRLPAFDLAWIIDHPVAAAAIVAALAAVIALLLVRASRHAVGLKRRLAQGFAVLGDLRAYLRSVAAWQAADWVLRLATIFFFLRAFGIGVDVDVGTNVERALLAQVAQSVSGVVPLTPAGIGTEQALLVYLFAGEVPTGALISFSVGMQLILIAANVALGFGAVLAMLGTLRWRRHLERERAARAASAPGPRGSGS
jgi:uncharacterized membrane protein YbhN (UPF0104 family)